MGPCYSQLLFSSPGDRGTTLPYALTGHPHSSTFKHGNQLSTAHGWSMLVEHVGFSGPCANSYPISAQILQISENASLAATIASHHSGWFPPPLLRHGLWHPLQNTLVAADQRKCLVHQLLEANFMSSIPAPSFSRSLQQLMPTQIPLTASCSGTSKRPKGEWHPIAFARDPLAQSVRTWPVKSVSPPWIWLKGFPNNNKNMPH